MTPTTARNASTSAAGFAPLSERDVQAQTDSGSYSRGRAYFRQGRIHDTTLRDRTLNALCEGSDAEPYRVEVTLGQRGASRGAILGYDCTCPRGGFCKHIVAMLLAWIDDPGRFTETEPLRDRLSHYGQAELVIIIERMVRQHPLLEQILDLVPPADEANKPLDRERLHRLVRASLGSFTNYQYEWGVYPQVSQDLENLLDLGRQHVAGGRFGQAIDIFDAIREEVEAIYHTIHDDEGSLGRVLDDCDQGLATCLEAQANLPEDQQLSAADRERLIAAGYAIWRFDVFEAGGQDFGGGTLEVLADVATEDERVRLERWLDAEPVLDDWTRRAVTFLRITFREGQGLPDEQVLKLYVDAELWSDAARFLIEHDRVDEAIAIITRRIEQPVIFLDLASAMIAHNPALVDRALSMVEDRAWEVEKVNIHHDAMYRQWLAAVYQSHGRTGHALPLLERQFRQSPSLARWQEVRKVAQDSSQPDGTWDRLRPELIAMLRKDAAWPPLIDILLDEGDVGAALDAWDRLHSGKSRAHAGYWGPEDQEIRLANAAENDYPDRAVAIYRKKADQLIAMRTRQNYAAAAEYLARVMRLLVRNDREPEWRTLIDEIRTRNKNLRALREELDLLGL